MKKILIVEDDSFLQGLAAGKLVKAGFDVYTASTTEEAMSQLKSMSPDVAMLDLVLPGGGDGFTILKQIRENKDTANIPVIVFSNLAEEKDAKQAKELGANDFMVKSNFTLDELVTKINDLTK